MSKIAYRLCILIVWCFFSFCFSQRETNIWCFGRWEGLDFNGGVPVQYPVVPGSFNAAEGCSSIADASGNLLFYTDGVIVRNRIGGLMGGGLAGGGSSTQAALIAPYVGDPNKYYVFTTDGITTSGAWRGLCYAVVDMSIGANGALVGAANTQLVDTTCEKVACVMHANGIDFWVVTRKHFTNDWYAFLVTCNGPDKLNPVITSIGSSGYGPGYLKSTLDGKMLINAAASMEVFDFDNATGVLSNYRTISNNTNGYYGVSVSPNDSLIYGSQGNSVYRYERFAPIINVTEAIFTFTAGFGTGAMQLASDKKIYTNIGNGTTVSVLQTPNSFANPGLVSNAVNISAFSAQVQGGITAFFDQRYFGPKPQFAGPDTNICKGSSISIGVPAIVGLTYEWTPSAGLSNSNVANPVASPTTTTNYMLIAYNACDTVFDTVTVVVDTLPIMQVLNSVSICNGGSVILTVAGAANYSWSPSNGLSSTTGNNPGASPTITTVYSVTGIDGNGCSSLKTLTVTVNDLPALQFSPNTAICTGGNSLLTVGGANTYSWSPANGLSSSTGNSVNAAPVTTTTYSVTGTDLSGCSDTAYITVTVNNNVTITASANTSVCQGGSAILTASGATVYNWNPSTGLSASTGASVIANPSVSTTFTLIGYNPGGCDDTAYITIAVNSLPVISVSSDTTVCNGSIVSLSAGGATNYLWSPSSGLSSATGSSVTAMPSLPQSYTVTGTDGNNCSAYAVIQVNVNLLPVIAVSGNLSVCKGDSTILSAFGALNYQWFPAIGLNSTTAANVLFNNTANTSYTLTGIDTNGCTDTIVITVVVDLVKNASIYPAGPFCENETELPIGLAAVDTGGFWSGTGIVNTGTGKFSPSIAGPGIHQIIYTINGNCGDADTINISVYAKPVADAGANSTIFAGATVTLNGSGGVSYSWSPSSGLSCITCQNPVASPQTTTTYYIEVTDSNGCLNIDSVTVIIDIDCGKIFIPTAFSPNNDGQNDVYAIKGNNCIKKLQFAIYDRWGEKVFETTDPSKEWDGIYGGKWLDAAVFTFRLNCLLINGEQIVKNGNITLVK